MEPKMGTETRKPEVPRRLYSAFVALMERMTGSFSSSDMIAFWESADMRYSGMVVQNIRGELRDEYV